MKWEREGGVGKGPQAGIQTQAPSVLCPQGYRCPPHKLSNILYTFLIHIRVLVFRNDKGSKQQGPNMISQLLFISLKLHSAVSKATL